MAGSPMSAQLFEELMRKGYPEPFCRQICKYLNTDYTATRMLGYLSHYEYVRPEEIADEMIFILEDRQRFIEKAETEKANAAYNDYLQWRRSRPEEDSFSD